MTKSSSEIVLGGETNEAQRRIIPTVYKNVKENDSLLESSAHELESCMHAGPAPPAMIARMSISPDGHCLATTDDDRCMHSFNLDVVWHHSSLPSFLQLVHALTFTPSASSLLVLSFANNTLELYAQYLMDPMLDRVGSDGAVLPILDFVLNEENEEEEQRQRQPQQVFTLSRSRLRGTV